MHDKLLATRITHLTLGNAEGLLSAVPNLPGLRWPLRVFVCSLLQGLGISSFMFCGHKCNGVVTVLPLFGTLTDDYKGPRDQEEYQFVS